MTFVCLSLASAAAYAAGPYEPNDFYNSAYGPIEAGTAYSGIHETDNDDDYFFFYLAQRTQIQLRVTSPPDQNDDEACVEIRQQTHDGVGDDDLIWVGADAGETESGFVTLDRGKYIAGSPYNSCYADAGDGYTFTILPVGSTSTYEPFAQECASAQSTTETERNEHARLQAEHADAESEFATAKAKVRSARTRLRRAKRLGRPKLVAKRRAQLNRAKRNGTAKRLAVEAAAEAVKAQAQRLRGAEGRQASACAVPQ